MSGNDGGLLGSISPTPDDDNKHLLDKYLFYKTQDLQYFLF